MGPKWLTRARIHTAGIGPFPRSPFQEEFYYSLVRPGGGDTFLSLAPSAAFNHTFDVVEWAVVRNLLSFFFT